jgi:hypothetical protein
MRAVSMVGTVVRVAVPLPLLLHAVRVAGVSTRSLAIRAPVARLSSFVQAAVLARISCSGFLLLRVPCMTLPGSFPITVLRDCNDVLYSHP